MVLNIVTVIGNDNGYLTITITAVAVSNLQRIEIISPTTRTKIVRDQRRVITVHDCNAVHQIHNIPKKKAGKGVGRYYIVLGLKG